MRQDIRSLKIAIFNLMPTKITRETQLMRLLGNSLLQVEFDFVTMNSHESKNTPPEHLKTFYRSFDDIKSNCCNRYGQRRQSYGECVGYNYRRNYCKDGYYKCKRQGNASR